MASLIVTAGQVSLIYLAPIHRNLAALKMQVEYQIIHHLSMSKQSVTVVRKNSPLEENASVQLSVLFRYSLNAKIYRFFYCILKCILIIEFAW